MTKENEAAANALPATTSVTESPFLDLFCLLDMEAFHHPSLTGRDSWPNTASSNQGITAKFQPPWQTNSPHYRPDILQGSTVRPNYTVPGVVHHQKYVSVTPAVLSHFCQCSPAATARGLG